MPRAPQSAAVLAAVPARPAPPPDASLDAPRGPWLVLASAVVWSFGGLFGRLLGDLDSWTIVFWRASWAAAFLAGFLLWRDGARGAAAGFRAMGRPGVAVALCFATASTAFVVALGHTTVANLLLIQAGVPLIAALIAWAAFGERTAQPTWAAIAAVLAGVGIMVSPALSGAVAPAGDLLALLIAVCFATATVTTRRFAGVRMAPAVCLGALISAGVAAVMAPGLAVTAPQTGLLFGFGALNLGLGLALFVTGARLVPAPVAALLGTAETLLGPVWVWLLLGETPGARTLIGGGIVLAALLAHLAWLIARQRRAH